MQALFSQIRSPHFLFTGRCVVPIQPQLSELPGAGHPTGHKEMPPVQLGKRTGGEPNATWRSDLQRRAYYLAEGRRMHAVVLLSCAYDDDATTAPPDWRDARVYARTCPFRAHRRAFKYSFASCWGSVLRNGEFPCEQRRRQGSRSRRAPEPPGAVFPACSPTVWPIRHLPATLTPRWPLIRTPTLSL